jgi:hypothetical protein
MEHESESAVSIALAVAFARLNFSGTCFLTSRFHGLGDAVSAVQLGKNVFVTTHQAMFSIGSGSVWRRSSG